MTLVELIQWTLAGNFWRFAGAVILLATAGYSMSAGLTAVTQAFAHLLAGVRR